MSKWSSINVPGNNLNESILSKDVKWTHGIVIFFVL